MADSIYLVRGIIKMAMANAIIDNVMMGLIWTMLAGGIAIGLLFVILASQYKNKVTVRQITNSGKRVFHCKAKEITDKGNKYWKLTKVAGMKFPNMPYPPTASIETDEKGRLVCDAYLLPSGEWSFKEDRWRISDVPEEILELKSQNPEQYRAAVKQWRQEHYVVDQNPMTNTAKAEMMNQLEKAHEYKTNNIHTLVRDAMPYVFLVMMLLLVVVFWGELIGPAQEVTAKTDSITDKQLEIMEVQAEIMEDLKQIIKREQVIDGDDIVTNNINDQDNNKS